MTIKLIGDSGREYDVDKKEIMVGISSKVELEGRTYHIPLIDFDDAPPMNIWIGIKKVQVKYGLPQAYILETSDGHRSAVFCKLVTWTVYKKILFDLDCDVNFRYYTIRSKCGTSRVTRKKDREDTVVTLHNIIPSCNKENDVIRMKIFEVIGFEKEDFIKS